MKNTDRKELLAAAHIVGAELYQTQFWNEVEKELDTLKSPSKSDIKVEPRNVTNRR